MYVGVGYSGHPDTEQAGTNAAHRALRMAGRNDPDFVLLFASNLHEPGYLRAVVASVVGANVPIVGGSAIGAITNDRFGYTGEQVGLAAVWMEGAGFELYAKGGLIDNELVVGERLGLSMAKAGIKIDTPTILLYDAINRSRGDVRLNLATPLLEGMEKGLGFLPSNMVGAGLQGDYENNEGHQWVADATVQQNAMLLAFPHGIRLDSAIMHGCRPAGDYYTVTKADRQTILEINGQPAIPFVESQLHPALPADAFPFFMIFGINRGEEDGDFNDDNYANRLCLDIDKERNGIVMFESDMVAGTRFQIMYRSLDLDYIPAKVNALFKNLQGRKPSFAFYIDCAGRAARYGTERDDAIVVQKAVDGRVPLLGIYSGVEIAPIKNRPRTLDWTGVFCLFSEEA
ncbi:MAG: FIST C-terminal domain-containing protein [Planctomycetaceae bacterium]|nr:FIST C-terminal domain-containing protein [Planctomycetaceae bacterium]